MHRSKEEQWLELYQSEGLSPRNCLIVGDSWKSDCQENLRLGAGVIYVQNGVELRPEEEMMVKKYQEKEMLSIVSRTGNIIDEGILKKAA